MLVGKGEDEQTHLQKSMNCLVLDSVHVQFCTSTCYSTIYPVISFISVNFRENQALLTQFVKHYTCREFGKIFSMIKKRRLKTSKFPRV